MTIFSKGFISSILDLTNLADLCEENDVALKKIGDNYQGYCPFHPENTPSFQVNSDHGFYYCESCYASGDVIKFMMMKQHISFMDAVRRLKDRVHLGSS
jgi:DNA primase